jgi:hypothetical protein
MNFLMFRQLNRKDIRLAVDQNKKPLFEGWTAPSYKEKKTIEQLLAENGCYGLRTGKQVGSGYFVVLDFDYNMAFLEFIDKVKISWIKTGRGAHVYLLMKKLPANGRIYCGNDKIGDLLSDGRQVIGIGSLHASGSRYVFNERGKYFWKMDALEDLKRELAKCNLEIR